VTSATNATDGVASVAHAIRKPEARRRQRPPQMQIAIEASASAPLSQRCCAVIMLASAIAKARKNSVVSNAQAREA
jgi:hypothetical protein